MRNLVPEVSSNVCENGTSSTVDVNVLGIHKN